VRIIDPLIVHPNLYPGAPTCPYTSEVLRIRERTPTPYFFVVVTFEFVIESIKEFGGASIRLPTRMLKTHMKM